MTLQVAQSATDVILCLSAVELSGSASCCALLQKLAAQALDRWALRKVAIAHRTGRVNVAEASVIVCTSSAHRLSAIEACHWLIDELKATVPIWKREFFRDGSVWKENAESRRHQALHAQEREQCATRS